jgi:hypothetical protein
VSRQELAAKGRQLRRRSAHSSQYGSTGRGIQHAASLSGSAYAIVLPTDLLVHLNGCAGCFQSSTKTFNFRRPDLFMPWSVAFSLLASPSSAGPALRNHLSHGLHGPLGLSDSTQWMTGASMPSHITARHDFWNVSLSTMAMSSFLFNPHALAGTTKHESLRLSFPHATGGNPASLKSLDPRQKHAGVTA